MAGIAPETEVGFVVQNLKDLLADNADLFAGAEEEAWRLCQELEALQVFLERGRKDCNGNDFADNLAKTVRNFAFEAEDAIESYFVISSKQKARPRLRGAIYAKDRATELRRILRELETAKEALVELYTTNLDLENRTLQMETAGVREQRQRIKKPPFDDEMVGYKDAMVDILELMNGGPEDLEIISIVGMPGLGKTTLARKVFKHPTIEYQFSIRAFVVISSVYKTEEVFLEILRACGTDIEEMNSKSEDELVQAIINNLGKSNFLIVLDDVWSVEILDDLKRALPTNQKRSRVLITTRSSHVAEYAGQGLEFKPHKLRFLTNEESRELLRTRIFGKNDEIPSDLLVHESHILRQCKGLPLAIVLLAGMLANYWTDSHCWQKVAENVDSDHNLLESVAQLSFSNLSYCLKPCFLYLGVFPEGSEIPSKTVMQLWVSEGFIPTNGDRSSEETAEEFLEELVERSLVMVEKRRSNGLIKTIRIHDTLHEFCETQGFRERLFREIKHDELGSNISSDNDRRFCINSNVMDYCRSRPLGQVARSFLCFAKENVILPLELLATIPRAFELLRVLDIRSIRFGRFPVELCYLFLLKYIAVHVELRIIPEKVSNLRYVQTIIFETSSRSLEIKADIWKMTRLRHLETNASTRLRRAMEALSVNADLQTLTAISPESCTSDVFDRAPQLKKLGIRGTLSPVLEATGQDSLFHSLSKLELLENLKLLNDNPTVKLHSLHCENSFPKKLKSLTLQNTMLDWTQISTLGKLENLEKLKLKDNAFLGATWETKNDGFRALKVLHIGSTDLVTWKASASHFPTLARLFLRHCTKLKAIPPDLVNLSTLQLIDLYRCNSSAATSARKIQLVKLQLQSQGKHEKKTTLKLSIYPPDQ